MNNRTVLLFTRYGLGDAPDELKQRLNAGTKPAGYVHPNARRVLSEIGLDHQGRSKHADEFRETPFDLVVTVCDDAAEDCPVWLGQGKRVHLGFPDPAKASGSDDDVLAVFRQVRDDIALKIPALLKQWSKADSKPETG